MKPRYKINQVVKIKATGEKVMIMATWNQDFYKNPSRENEYYVDYSKGWIKESELKPYCPSRIGTRDPKTGRFVSREVNLGINRLCNTCGLQWCRCGNRNSDGSMKEDSKQRNYQRILARLTVLEKKIDELGRRVWKQ